jgi:hypothetical protein
MRGVSETLAVIAFGAGLSAAWYWFSSTQVGIDPSEYKNKEGQQFFQMMKWIKSVMDTSATVAQLNAKAAWWTAISVLASGLSTLLNAWSSN